MKSMDGLSRIYKKSIKRELMKQGVLFKNVANT